MELGFMNDVVIDVTVRHFDARKIGFHVRNKCRAEVHSKDTS